MVNKKSPSHLIIAVLLLFAGTFFLPSRISAEEAGKKKTVNRLRKERRRVRYDLLQTRGRLLREDPELKRLHDRILDLYRKMDRLLGEKPKIRELRKRLKHVEKRLHNHDVSPLPPLQLQHQSPASRRSDKDEDPEK